MAVSQGKVTSPPDGVNGPEPLPGPGPLPGAESARRVLDVVLAFSTTRHTLSAKEIADLTGIPLPSVYRYVALLRDAGLLIGGSQGYHLSTRFIALSRAAQAAEGIIEIARDTVRRLADRTGETVLLARLITGTPVCVHRVESPHKLRYSFDPGEPLPLDRGATSRVLLGPVDWAVAAEELDEGIWAASAAIRGADGEVCAALTLTAPLFRTPPDARDRLTGLVRGAAAEVSSLLGYPRARAT